eukprot:365052-Chlamydomonas_euryale.AAC.24
MVWHWAWCGIGHGVASGMVWHRAWGMVWHRAWCGIGHGVALGMVGAQHAWHTLAGCWGSSVRHARLQAVGVAVSAMHVAPLPSALPMKKAKPCPGLPGGTTPAKCFAH